jgi:hypothetical protein
VANREFGRLFGSENSGSVRNFVNYKLHGSQSIFR